MLACRYQSPVFCYLTPAGSVFKFLFTPYFLHFTD